MSEEKRGVNFLQPTKFWECQSLEKLWAHLDEECLEAMREAIPYMRCAGSMVETRRKNAIMELVDVQIMCNTILAKLDFGPSDMITMEDMDHAGRCGPRCSDNIMNFVEMWSLAFMEYRKKIRCSSRYMDVDDLRLALFNVGWAAQRLMDCLAKNDSDIAEARKEVWKKNDNRGYYL